MNQSPRGPNEESLDGLTLARSLCRPWLLFFEVLLCQRSRGTATPTAPTADALAGTRSRFGSGAGGSTARNE